MEEYSGVFVPALKEITKNALSKHRINTTDIADVTKNRTKNEPEFVSNER